MCAVNSKRRSPCNFYLILLFVLKYFLKGKVKKDLHFSSKNVCASSLLGYYINQL